MQPSLSVVDTPTHPGLHPVYSQHDLRHRSTASLRGIVHHSALAANSKQEKVMPMSSALQRPHVLIVSDDAGLSSFLGEGLIYEGLWTSAIASALQTLEVFRLRSFDAVIVDAALQGLGAGDLIARLRASAPDDRSAQGSRTDIPILVIAERPDEIEIASLDSSLVTRTLIAPIELDELAQILGTAISSWRTDHPDRPWADAALLETSSDRSTS
jgi:CheY-like chemotaxis protein